MANLSDVTIETILDAAKLIRCQAEKDRWEITLDRDEGALYFSPKRIPDDAKLFRATDEYSVYLDSANRLKGVMIECYGTNFVKHHEQFEEITREIFENKQTRSKPVVVLKKSSEKREMTFRKMLEDALVADSVVEQLDCV